MEQRQKDNFAVAAGLRERVNTLWDRLQIPQEERTEFTTQNTGFKPRTIKAVSIFFLTLASLSYDDYTNTSSSIKPQFHWGIFPFLFINYSFSFMSFQLKEELARCESLMSANLKQVIEATRRELTEWWDKCYYSRQQREEFKPFFSGRHHI